MYKIGIIKTYFAFGRMHVYVIVFIRHSDKQKYHRESVRFQQTSISLFDCVRDEFISDESAVEKYVLELATCSGIAGSAHQAEDVQALFLAFSLKQVFGDLW